MKYIILCIAMLCCFAFAGERSSASPFEAPTEVAPLAVDQIAEDDGEEAIDCGGRVCGKGTYCCNASCGICVPKGWSCTQQSCN